MKQSLLGKTVPALLTTIGVIVPSATVAGLVLKANAQPAAQPPAASVPPPSTPTRSRRTGRTSISNGSRSGLDDSRKSTPTPTPTARPTKSTSGSFTGEAVQDPFGVVQATITVSNGKITDVSITAPESDPRSAFINDQAVPMLKSETLQAQSANIGLISGATLTTEAYAESLQNALQKAGI